MKRRALIAVLAITTLVGSVGALAPLPEALVRGRGAVIVEDATGQLLREPPGDDGLRAEWVALRDVPAAIRDAVVSSEDHLLAWHPGVDPAGLVRAAWLDVRARRVVAGGSTLAMQLARLSFDLPRDLSGKLAQLVLAPWLTARLGRDGVLEAYLNLAPYGRDVRGIAAASRVYFGKPLRDLTLGEAVALACLPRGPSLYDPHRGGTALRARRAHVLARMEERGMLERGRADVASEEPLHLVPFARTFRAPHAVALARHQATTRVTPFATRVRTTLDAGMQRSAQGACKQAVESLEHQAATDCAAVVMRISTGEVLALVGSPDFRSPHAGQVNAALALRQPGSALKPFVYALAFAEGLSPASTIDDVPTSFEAPFGTWSPRNYDERFHGTVTLREALASSYNIPAVKLAALVGIDRVVSTLGAAGVGSLAHAAEHYGIGIALGDADVTLYDLVTAYATLARGGEFLEPTLLVRVERAGDAMPLPTRERRRVFSPEVSYLVGHVLQDRAARRAAFGASSVLELPFDAAVKTGTSSSFRDNWTVGYAGDLVVGVWVGRHDGAPMLGVSGVAGAGPAFRRIMLYALGKTAGTWPPPPAGLSRQRFGDRMDLTLAARP